MKMNVRSLPIRKKLMAAIVITSASGLLFAGLVFMFYTALQLRKDAQNDFTVHAQQTGSSCMFSMSFEVPDDALRILQGLDYLEGFEAVALMRLDGSVFVSHSNAGQVSVVRLAEQSSGWFSHIQTVSQPIKSGDELVGTILMAYNLDRFRYALVNSLLVFLLGLVAAVLVAHQVGKLFRRTISNPIEILTSTVRSVEETGDYSLRAEVKTPDEIGQLATNFNSMLIEVEKRDDELMRNEARFRSLVDDAVDSILLINKDGSLADCNVMACNSLMTDKASLLQLDIYRIIANLDAGVFSQLWEAAFKGSHPLLDTHMLCSDESSFPAEVKLGSIQHQNKQLLIAFCRDVTEREKAEEKLRQTEENLRQREKMDSIGQLAGGIAHDFNNALAGIFSSAEMIKTKPTPENIKKYSQLILTSAKQAAGLTEKLLTFSRKKALEYAPFNVNKIVRDAITILERSLDPLVEIVEEYDPQLSSVSGDAALIQSVIMNLGINARDAMKSKGQLTISTGITDFSETDHSQVPLELEPRRYVHIKVVDTGSGISEELQKRIFEPFFTTKDVGEGTGMGLSSAYGIIKEHNGVIHLESEIGVGSVFTIYLPALDFSILEQSEGDPRETVRQEKASSCRILLVDDEQVVRTVVASMLEHMGHTVTCAENGQHGVDFYREHYNEIDLVIIDMRMPQMNGADCFQEMKKINPSIRAMMASGYAEETSSEALIRDGVLAFINKPFEMSELKETVARVL